MTIRLGAGFRGRRAAGAVVTVAAAAAAVGLAVPAMAAPAVPEARILRAGHAAARSAVPWPKVGPGWALAMYSANQTAKAGPSTLYLVNPQGGRYKLVTWSARSPQAQWSLLGWSGDAKRALFAAPSGFVGAHEHVYQLRLQTGKVTDFTLPASVAAVGYTRPDGLNILAEKSTRSSFTAQRYGLTGKLQKSLATFKFFDGIVYSSDGTELAGGTSNGLELISNAGGVIRKLRVPGVNADCNAVRWWSSRTVLASCSVTNEPGPRMWLVPASGARPTALTPVRTASGFDLGDFNAWKLSSGLYVDVQEGACGSLVIGRQPAHGKEQMVNVPGSGSSLIVNATSSTLMVERMGINPCTPGRSLAVFNPATRKTTVAIPVSHHQIGVTAVVPYYISGKF
jgi:TolB protein